VDNTARHRNIPDLADIVRGGNIPSYNNDLYQYHQYHDNIGKVTHNLRRDHNPNGTWLLQLLHCNRYRKEYIY
jgi:hypothetical protein